MSENIFRAGLFISGMINFIPSILAFFPEKISQSYGIPVPDANYELLLRHRAIMLGIIGGAMIYSALSKKNYNLSIVIGLISMVSFLILYYSMNAPINPELTKVMQFDIVGIVILLIAVGVYKLRLF